MGQTRIFVLVQRQRVTHICPKVLVTRIAVQAVLGSQVTHVAALTEIKVLVLDKLGARGTRYHVVVRTTQIKPLVKTKMTPTGETVLGMNPLALLLAGQMKPRAKQTRGVLAVPSLVRLSMLPIKLLVRQTPGVHGPAAIAQRSITPTKQLVKTGTLAVLGTE